MYKPSIFLNIFNNNNIINGAEKNIGQGPPSVERKSAPLPPTAKL